MNYFDLHCDSATALFAKGETLVTSSGQVSLKTLSSYSIMTQAFAIFSRPELSDDECYGRFFEVADHFERSNCVSFTNSLDGALNALLTVEDARLLCKDIDKLYALRARGVCVLTLLWSGVTCIGGSYDTDEGLSAFGKEVVRECFMAGIIPDVSHASVRSCSEALDIAEEYSLPVIASHSDSYDINPHPRNLSRDNAKRIAALGGIIGICLHAPHVGENATLDKVCDHISYFANTVGADHVALGCDLDGTRYLPEGVKDQSDVIKLSEAMRRSGFGEKEINNIFYENAYAFFKKNLRK